MEGVMVSFTPPDRLLKDPRMAEAICVEFWVRLLPLVGEDAEVVMLPSGRSPRIILRAKDKASLMVAIDNVCHRNIAFARMPWQINYSFA